VRVRDVLTRYPVTARRASSMLAEAVGGAHEHVCFRSWCLGGWTSMQAESSYNCCRLQHGCRFVQLQVRGCKLAEVTVRVNVRPLLECWRGARTCRRGRRLAGLVAAAQRRRGAGGRARERLMHTYYLLPLCLSSFCSEHTCFSTLSVFLVYLQECRDPRAPRHQHTAAAPVAWIPWR